MMKKMRNWEMDEGSEERIIAQLIKEKFIDEERFAKAFVRDKFQYNRWGKIRIIKELKMRKIAEKHIEIGLKEIEENDQIETLKEIIRKKRPSVKGKNEYEIKGKLIRFALGRGFEMNEIVKVVGDLDEMD
jgi:regulatory protein